MLSLKALAVVALLVGMSIHLFVADTGPMALLQSAVRSNLRQLQPMYLLLYVPYFVNKFRYKATLPNKKVDWKAPPTPGVADAKRPNVILLLADDLGFNDISFYGGGFSKGLVKTPNIDSIGRNGVAFKNAYSGHATCAPSRASLITGKYPTRVGYEFTPATQAGSFVLGRLMGNNELTGIYHSKNRQLGGENYAIPEKEIMISSALKDGGYNNVYLGKWHNGNDKKMKSVHRGFDDFLGFSLFSKYLEEGDPRAENCYLNDFFDNFLRTNVRYHVEHNSGDYFKPDGYLTDYLANEAVNAISANKNNPFFMFASFTAVHSPLTALKDDYYSAALDHIEDHCDRVYAAMIVALDRAVGKILQSVRDNGLEDNTMVIFTSDNGAPNFINKTDINLPYRGWKASFFEGGIHVPMFVQWPGRIPPASSKDALVSHVDLFPSIMAAAGLPVKHDVDGMDFLPLITSGGDSSEVTTPIPSMSDTLHDTLFWRSDHYLAIRKGDWKLHVVSVPEPKVWLFNLRSDKRERYNLADSLDHKVVLNELMDKLHAINATQIEPLWPTLSCTPILIDKVFADSYIVGDTYVYWPN